MNNKTILFIIRILNIIALGILIGFLIPKCGSNNQTQEARTIVEKHYKEGATHTTEKHFYHNTVTAYQGKQTPLSIDTVNNIRVYSDSIPDSNLTIFVKDSVKGEKLFSKINYRLKVPVVLETLRVDTLRIDSIVFMPPPKKKHWVISAGAGYGATPNGLEPSININVGYKLFEF